MFVRVEALPGEKFPAIRDRHVTASVVAALFGEHDYTTEWQLWQDIVHGKRTRSTALAASLGNHMESAIASALEEHETMTLEKEHGYIYHEGLRLGASLDYWCFKWGDREFQDGIPLDIKMVGGPAYASKWKSGAEVPAIYLLQMIAQMYITGTKTSLLGLMIAGQELKVIEVPWSQPLWDALEQRLVAFWESVEARREPLPDIKRDGSELLNRYRNTVEGTSVDLTSDNELADIANQYRNVTLKLTEMGREVRSLEKMRDELKAAIVSKIGTAERATCAGFQIETKTTKRKGFTVQESVSRSITVKEV